MQGGLAGAWLDSDMKISNFCVGQAWGRGENVPIVQKQQKALSVDLEKRKDKAFHPPFLISVPAVI